MAMIEFILNKEPAAAEREMSLLTYLREVRHLTSVKDGCSQGACGACMVLVDGRARPACAVKLSRIAGSEVLTLEGLDREERELYAEAFARSGAVQCGYCTPGMIISAKALLDTNPAPSRREIGAALGNNICRCTGYRKIEQAVELVAAVKRGEAHLPPLPENGGLGVSLPRSDAYAKALGLAEYAGDLYPLQLLYGAVKRSDYPRARVLAIDINEAVTLPGVRRVATAADIPGKSRHGHLRPDYPVLINLNEITHFAGDAIALVAADSEQIARKAAALIRVEYQVLEPILSPEDAAAEGAPQLQAGGNLLAREILRRGDAEAALAASLYQVRNTYRLPFSEHAFLEPECAVALPEEGGLTLYTGDQGVFQTRQEVAAMLGLKLEKVRVRAKAVGGGFGGKEDMSVQHHAALLAWLTGRPVKLRLTRDESLLVHPKRHAMTIEIATGLDGLGHITAVQARIIADTGAYASLGVPVLQRACTHAAGPYRIENVDIVGEAYYTNNPPAGAFRGFGVAQSATASECNLNQLAALAHLDPWWLRYLNAVYPGDRLPNGQRAGVDTAIAECLLAVKPFYDAHPVAGIACAMKNSGLGVGVPDVGRARIAVENGRAVVYCSAACIGQGMNSVLRQMVCHAAGLTPEEVASVAPDTALTPDSGNTTASRQTLFAGEAARRAAFALAAALKEKGSLAALQGREFSGEYRGVTDRINTDKEEPRFHIAYSFAAHAVALDAAGRVEKVCAAHDVGRAVNPQNVEGQIEGGVTMALGYGLTERFTLEQGRPMQKFAQLGLLKSTETPEIETHLVTNAIPEALRDALPAAGAKGVGEISAIPTAAAVQGAYFKRDGKFRTSLPLEDTAYNTGCP